MMYRRFVVPRLNYNNQEGNNNVLNLRKGDDKTVRLNIFKERLTNCCLDYDHAEVYLKEESICQT